MLREQLVHRELQGNQDLQDKLVLRDQLALMVHRDSQVVPV